MLASFAPTRRTATAQASKPNVLLIMTDDQPYHTIEVMESLRNRVVAASMRFDNGYVATPVCGPARGSVLTGKWSHNTGLEKMKGAWRDLVDSGELARNVATRLKGVGYSCHLSGKFTNDLSSGKWVCPGFESWWAQLEDLNDKEHLYFSKDGSGRREMRRTATEEGNEALVAAKYTENFLRSRRDRPWFACFWPHAPHSPLLSAPQARRCARGPEAPDAVRWQAEAGRSRRSLQLRPGQARPVLGPFRRSGRRM